MENPITQAQQPIALTTYTGKEQFVFDFLQQVFEPKESDKQQPLNQHPSKATPFLKWAGGKRNIMQQLTAKLPDTFNNYYEPFAGGGALFFELQPQLNKAFLSDTNPDLINTYTIIKNDVSELLKLLQQHQNNHSEDYYYRIRSQHDLHQPLEIAARMIYLNKTCFNGLWRVNRKGQFNVAFGKYANPAIVQESNLRACAAALQYASITCNDYSTIQPKAGDFVYIDPPYHLVNEMSFTAYTKAGFTANDQAKLAAFCTQLHSQGVKLMISNSNTDYIKHLYSAATFNISTVTAPRFVNCKASGRKPVEELLITNY